MLHCPNCNKQYESGKFCPECGVPLVEDQPQQAAGVSITLGDANAISGGIHVANTTNIQNTYIQEREKSESELEQEKRIKFMSLCEKVFEDGILENYEIVQLEDKRIKLGLDKDTANMMIEQARKSCISTKTTLAARDAITMKIINMQIQKNDIVQIKAQFPKLEAMHDVYKNDAVDSTYFMLLSTLYSDRFIESYEKSKADDYWQTYWAYIAYLKRCKLDKAEKTLAKLNWFTRYPESNGLLLSALNSIMEFGSDVAKDYLTIVEAEPCSPELNPLYYALLFEVDLEKAMSLGINDNDLSYYLDAVVRMEHLKGKAIEEVAIQEWCQEIRRKRARCLSMPSGSVHDTDRPHLTNTDLKFLRPVNKIKSALAAKVTRNLNDKEAREAYNKVKDAWQTLMYDASFEKERDIVTLREMVIDCPLAVETIDSYLPEIIKSL